MAKPFLPLGLWHKFFCLLLNPYQELFITSWSEKYQVPSVNSSRLGRFQADLHMLQLLGREDVLFPGSAGAFWKWLVPLTIWRVELFYKSRYNGVLPPPLPGCDSIWYTQRLEMQFGARINHIVVVIDAFKWDIGYSEEGDVEWQCIYPSVTLMEQAVEHFWHVQTFTIVFEMLVREAMSWFGDRDAVGALWDVIMIRDGGCSMLANLKCRCRTSGIRSWKRIAPSVLPFEGQGGRIQHGSII